VTGHKAWATATGAVHAARFAFWIGVEVVAEAAGRHATTIADTAEQRARRAENDLERVTGMAS
jgi:hypothetical protein